MAMDRVYDDDSRHALDGGFSAHGLNQFVRNIVVCVKKKYFRYINLVQFIRQFIYIIYIHILNGIRWKDVPIR